MSDLPTIPGLGYTVPAQDAQTYPDAALVRLTVETPPSATSLAGQTARIVFSPYNKAAGALPPQAAFPVPGSQVPLESPPPVNIWAEAQRSTLFAQALGAVVQYSALALQEWRLTQQIAAAEAARLDHASLDEQLAAVREQLGVSA